MWWGGVGEREDRGAASRMVKPGRSNNLHAAGGEGRGKSESRVCLVQEAQEGRRLRVGLMALLDFKIELEPRQEIGVLIQQPRLRRHVSLRGLGHQLVGEPHEAVLTRLHGRSLQGLLRRDATSPDLLHRKLGLVWLRHSRATHWRAGRLRERGERVERSRLQLRGDLQQQCNSNVTAV